MRLVDCIEFNATRFPDRPAVVCGGVVLSYARFWEAVRRRAENFVGGRRVVAFRASQTVDFLVDYFAVHLAGLVAAPLDRDMPEAVFEEVSGFLRGCGVSGDAADVLYTTGTTGRSKGVAVGHRAIMANAENLVEAQGWSGDLVFIVTGPLNHIGSLSKVWAAVFSGATVCLVDGLKDMNAFFAALDFCRDLAGKSGAEGLGIGSSGAEGFGIATFLVPSAIRMLLRFGGDTLAGYDGAIEFVETGADAVSREDMAGLCRVLPRARLYNTYASTETGIVATYDFNAGGCVEGCVGRPMRHSSVRISDEGMIVCAGAMVSAGYAGDEEGTRAVLREGEFFTSDMGFIDGDGRLHVSGRADDVINVGGVKVAPTEVEDAARSMPGIADCVCVAAEHPVAGRALKLLYVTDGSVGVLVRDLARFLKARLESYKVPLLYEAVPEISRTAGGKVDRKAYR